MMIEFHILGTTENRKALLYVCDVIEQAWRTHKSVYVQASSLAEAEKIDGLLWTFRDDSFIPHGLWRANEIDPPPVQIGYDAHPTTADTLVNLSTEIPSFYSASKRMIEIVFPDPTMQQLARERFKHYRNEGHELQTHKIK